jgi:signal transduction histidine kinase
MSPNESPPLRRDPGRGIVAGVLAGLSVRIGVDPVILRVAFVVVTIATGGLALLGYLIAWATMPVDGARSAPIRALRLPQARTDWRVAVGVGLLTLAALLGFRELGIWWSDALVWPLVLAAFGATLLWSRFRKAGEPGEPAQPEEARPPSRFAELYSGVFGVLLVVGAGLLFLSSNNILGGVRDVALTTVVVVVSLSLILAPFLWRLGRNLAAERAERIRSQERAELAAHLHDSVLQTLTLMQKRADDPREVAALARRQERELREWLSGDGHPGDERSLARALRTLAEKVEDDHRVAIEVVVVGDCEPDERTEALLGATREALVNAAKHAAEPGPIRVYAEIEAGTIEVFVRDRGPGFDIAMVPADRRGVRESIVARMQRAGGTATVGSGPGGGTEIALALERAETSPEGERQ